MADRGVPSDDPAAELSGPPSLRVDKWLFHSRLVKSRSLAARLVEGGNVRVNGVKICQPSRAVRPGDMLTVSKDRRILVVEIKACGQRRGPANEARMLYVDHSPAPVPDERSVFERLSADRVPGSGRPTKKERRQTDQLRNPFDPST